jgi:hypothetical protein
MVSRIESFRMRAKHIAPDEAAALVKSGDWVDYGFGREGQAAASAAPRTTSMRCRPPRGY